MPARIFHHHFRYLFCCSCLLALPFSGCGQPAQLAEQGAHGVVLARIWESGNRDQPTLLRAERVVQQDNKFHRLLFTPVLMRVPKGNGVVYIAADHAIYDRDAVTAIELSEPVHFSGQWRGQLFSGRAQHASVDPKNRSMHLREVELVYEGGCQRTVDALVHQDAVPFGHFERLPDTPAVIAALAAVPQPLVLPEFGPDGK